MPSPLASYFERAAAEPAPKPTDEQLIAAWLEQKARSYPPNTPPERAAQWQDYDRKRYQAHQDQKAAVQRPSKAAEQAAIGLLQGLRAMQRKP